MKRVQLSPNNAFEEWRLWVIYGALIAIFGFFGFRLFSLQIIQGSSFAAQADENRTSQINIPTQRGIIYDRNGSILARNVASYNVVVTPAEMPGAGLWPLGEPYTDGTVGVVDSSVQEIYRQLSEMIDVPVSNGLLTEDSVRAFSPCQTDFGITQIVVIGDTNHPYEPIRIKCNISREQAMTIQEKAADWPGVGIEVEPIRDYPTGELTSEVIGFLGPIPGTEEQYYTNLGFQANRDKIGYSGVESTLNDLLMGRNGTRLVERDVAGQILRDLEPPTPAVPGNNVRLTVDVRLQQVAEESLKYWMHEMATNPRWRATPEPYRYTSGVVIAMNPKTGEVLSLVSYPKFENNRMARFIPGYYYSQLDQDPAKPLLNHAISAEFPPGSVFKMSAAIGILNEGVVKPDTVIEDPGKITIENKFSQNDPLTRSRDYVCYIYKSTNAGHGDVDYLKGVSQSCDVYFYKVGGGYKDEVPGNGLGIWRLGEYARALGYGQTTGIELPGEMDGMIPDPNWKRRTVGENWATGDTYISTIGQGFVLSTPLQVLVSVATLANDGKMMQPTLVREVLDAEGNVIKPFEPKLKHDITQEPVINIYDENFQQTGQKKVVQPWVIEKAKEGMRLVVTEGTAHIPFQDVKIPSAGKTGTAEYCDDIADDKGLCEFGKWPAHAWYVGYAPYDDPEIAVVAFVYNGDEGAVLAAPIAADVIKAYFELKAMDTAGSSTAPGQSQP